MNPTVYTGGECGIIGYVCNEVVVIIKSPAYWMNWSTNGMQMKEWMSLQRCENGYKIFCQTYSERRSLISFWLRRERVLSCLLSRLLRRSPLRLSTPRRALVMERSHIRIFLGLPLELPSRKSWRLSVAERLSPDLRLSPFTRLSINSVSLGMFGLRDMSGVLKVV